MVQMSHQNFYSGSPISFAVTQPVRHWIKEGSNVKLLKSKLHKAVCATVGLVMLGSN